MCLRKLFNKIFSKNRKQSSLIQYNNGEENSFCNNTTHKNKINVVSCKIKLIEQ